MSWKQAWEQRDTPWDAGKPAPSLVELVAAGNLPAGRALVPGAGSGWDVLALAAADRHTVGLDLADGARRRFEQLRDQQGVPAEQAEMVVGDFFTWQPSGPFDLMWDYTFLCAIDPQRRADWAARVDQLLAADGELITLIFPVVDKDPADGPPYALSPELVTELVEPHFEPVRLEPATASHPARAGREWIGRWRRP